MGDIFDLAIIGGGTNGYATFLTAVSSGLKVVLLEKDRIGQKANYASLGMIQPGLKYLHSDLDLVKMDALDCRLLRTITGDLLQSQSFILPVFSDYRFPLSKPWFWEIYLNAYDQFSDLALHPRGHWWLTGEGKKQLQQKFQKPAPGRTSGMGPHNFQYMSDKFRHSEQQYATAALRHAAFRNKKHLFPCRRSAFCRSPICPCSA